MFFPQCFQPYQRKKSSFLPISNLSSANAVKVEIVSFGKELSDLTLAQLIFLPSDKIFGLVQVKIFCRRQIKLDSKFENTFERLVNVVGKGKKKAGYRRCSPFLAIFLEASFAGSLKPQK